MELSTRLNIGNVRAAIDAVRPSIKARGLDIYSNVKSSGKNKYRIGNKRESMSEFDLNFPISGAWFPRKTYVNLTEVAGLTVS